MNHKKPTPILANRSRKICPVCEKPSYSASGIHPQCAVHQADAARKEQLKAKKELEATKKSVAKEQPRAWSKKKCPKCNVVLHVRKKTCDCGFEFPSP